jgi:hypothetical protein
MSKCSYEERSEGKKEQPGRTDIATIKNNTQLGRLKDFLTAYDKETKGGSYRSGASELLTGSKAKRAKQLPLTQEQQIAVEEGRRVWHRHRNLERVSQVFYVACQLFNFWQEQYGYLRGTVYQMERKYEMWEEKLLKICQARNPGVIDLLTVDDALVESVLEGSSDELIKMLDSRGLL